MSSVHNPIVILDDDEPTTTHNVNYNHHQHHHQYHHEVTYDEDDDGYDEDDDNIMMNTSMMMIMNPVRMEKYRQRMDAARTFLQRATETSNIVHAEKIINEACELLENWTMDYDEEVVHSSAAAAASATANETIENPFATFLAQARHRLGQIALLKGDLQSASTLFLHVILHDSHTLSPSALAMTWYDVALIFMTYGNTRQAEESLERAYGSLMNQETQQVNRDETLFLFIQQAMIRLVDSVTHNIPASLVGLPFSSQFTVVTYNFDSSNENNSNNNGDGNDDDTATNRGSLDGSAPSTIPSKSSIQEESRRLLDPSIWAAGAA